MVRSYVSQMAGKPPRAGVNVDEVVALGAAIQAAMEVGEPIGDAVPRFTLGASQTAAEPAPPRRRRVTDVMSHSLGTVAVSPDGSAYVNDLVIRRNVPIPASDSRSYLHATHGGANDRLEVYLTQGESRAPLDCTILGKYVFRGIEPTGGEVAVDVGLSYDANGVVQVRAVQRDTGRELADDRRAGPGRPLLAGPAAGRGASRRDEPEPIRVFLLIDVSASMTGQPMDEAQTAAREFLARCDFTTTEVGLISFSTTVALQAAGDEQRPPAARGDPPARGRGEHEPHRRPGDGPRPARRRRPPSLHRHPDRRLSRRPRERRRAGRGGAAGRDRDRRDRHGRRRPRLPPPAGQQRAGVDLRQERRAGADLRPHRPRHRRGRRAPCGCCHERRAAHRPVPHPDPARVRARPGPTSARRTTWR